MLAARWKMERLRAATEALELVGMAAVVLTADCGVMAANSLAEGLSEHLLWVTRDRLALADNAASTKLRKQVSACASLGSAGTACSFPAWNETRNSAVIVHLIPLQGQRRDLFDGGLALAVFTPAMTPGTPDSNVIRELFDLTVAESRVAAQLAIGRSIGEIAGDHRVSVSTVRSQTKSILQKVGAHRQSELAARLGSATFPTRS
jgi:DNA-binding CsgD family transcriptional regulator